MRSFENEESGEQEASSNSDTLSRWNKNEAPMDWSREQKSTRNKLVLLGQSFSSIEYKDSLSSEKTGVTSIN